MHRDLPAARRGPRRAGIAAAFVVLSLAGEWAGHAATWYLTGGATPGQALSGASHSYLGPVGVLIAVLTVVTSLLVWRGIHRLGALARTLDAAVRRAWRVDPRHAPLRVPAASEVDGLSVARLWVALASVQLVVYLVQENVESRATGHGLPGLQVLTAHHGSALVVHAAIALLGAALAIEVTERWLERRQAVSVAGCVYRAITSRRSTALCAPPGHLPPLASPLSLVGRSILSRPPPLQLSA